MKTVSIVLQQHPETNGLDLKGMRDDCGVTLGELSAALDLEVAWLKAVEEGSDTIEDGFLEYVGMVLGPMGRMKKYMRGMH